MKTLCKRVGKSFENYDYAPVGWSSDKLPVCPFCRETPYSGKEFEQNHQTLKEQQHASE